MAHTSTRGKNTGCVQKQMTDFRKKIGQIPYREKESAALFCLAAFLKLNDKNINFESAIDIAPVETGVAKAPVLRFMGRRLGISMTEIGQEEILRSLQESAVLVQRDSGYAILLLTSTDGQVIAALPGGGQKTISCFAKDSDIFSGISSAHCLNLRGDGPALRKRYSRARTYLIPWRSDYQAKYSAEAVMQFMREFSKYERQVEAPGPLPNLSCEAIIEAHRLMCPSLPKYFGVYRKINLRRTAVFLAAESVKSALSELLNNVPIERGKSKEFYVKTSALLLVDFLTIHPFVNGNRRMGLAIAAKYLELNDIVIDWSKISRVELYYWIRCGSKGHFNGLIKMMMKNSENIFIEQ